LLLLSVFSALQLKVYYHFENFFPVDDPAYLAYKKFRTDFPVDDRMLILAVKADNGIFNTDFLNKVSLLESEIAESPFVEHVHSLGSLKIPIKTPLGYIQNSILSKDSTKLMADSMRLVENKEIVDYYISADKQHYSIFIELLDSTTDQENRIIIRSLENAVSAHQFEKYHIAGFLYTQVSYILLLEREIPYTSLLVAIGLTVILMLLYRSLTNTILLTGIVLIGLILFFGYLGMAGRTLNITSTLFITIMTIVGISDIIHLQTYYHKYLVKKHDRLKAITLALKDVRTNLFLTSLTTCAGFLTFLNSSIPHIASFGLDAAVGVFIAFLLAITLAPVLFYYFPPSESYLHRSMKHKKWDKFLFYIYKSGLKQKYFIIALSFILVLLSLVGIQRIDSNQTLSGNFSPEHKIKQDIEFFEEQYGGIRGFELMLSPKYPYSITEPIVFNSIAQIDTWLKEYGEFGPVLSPASWLRLSHQINTGFRTPLLDYQMDQEYVDYLIENDITGRKNHFINEENNSGRLSTKMRDIGINGVEELQDTFMNWIQTEGIDQILKIEITGSAILIDGNNKSVNREMFISLGIAFLFISVLMALLFKKINMVLISIVPNIIPLLAVGGLMSLTGIPLNAATSLIFTIGFVIAIDDTIHFLTRFKAEYSLHHNIEMAIKNTLNYTGRAVIHTTVILFVGYGSLVFSSFIEIVNHSILVAATLAFALIADLYLIPTLLRLAAKKGDLF
jgi:uncharacterized protein